jgi:hypothetical protein
MPLTGAPAGASPPRRRGRRDYRRSAIGRLAPQTTAHAALRYATAMAARPRVRMRSLPRRRNDMPGRARILTVGTRHGTVRQCQSVDGRLGRASGRGLRTRSSRTDPVFCPALVAAYPRGFGQPHM